MTARKSVWLCFGDCDLCVLSFLSVLHVYLNFLLFVYMNCVLCMLSFLFDLLCFDYCVLVVF